MKSFSIIVAVDEKMGIGKENALPWKLSRDMRHFKETTVAPIGAPGNVVIMGRKTWESLPEKSRPLPDRINVVLTHKEQMALPTGVLKFSSLQAALDEFYSAHPGRQSFEGNIFVIGGAQIYGEAIKHPSCRKLYITHIQKDFFCDVFFPKIPSSFRLSCKSEALTESELSFCFSVYEARP